MTPISSKNKKDSLEQCVVEAARNGEQIYDQVTKWLSKANEDIGEAEELISGKVGFCHNFKTRSQLSNKAAQKTSAIIRLYCEESLNAISFQPQITEPSMLNNELLPSRVFLLNQIMDALKDPRLNMIGIYGMGGIGKTALAKEVCARAREEKLFDDVIMISVSRYPNLRRIQAEIAGVLGLNFDAEEVPRRARQLYQRLGIAKLLIVLDDVWQKLDLLAVGIPFGDECQGCKLLVSSRKRDVLSSKMGSQKDFFVDLLVRGEESWSLFQTIPQGFSA